MTYKIKSLIFIFTISTSPILSMQQQRINNLEGQKISIERSLNLLAKSISERNSKILTLEIILEDSIADKHFREARRLTDLSGEVENQTKALMALTYAASKYQEYIQIIDNAELLRRKSEVYRTAAKIYEAQQKGNKAKEIANLAT